MKYYFIKDSNIKSIRLALKNIKIESYSSCYSLEEQFYIMISSKSELNDDFILYQYDTSNEKTVESVLLEWAYSQLLNNTKFIEYESKAENKLNYSIINFKDTIITRHYRPLGEIMLVINNTPNSFSDGGKSFGNILKISTTIEAALIAGVTIIDVGGESTAPGAAKVTIEEEISRVEPIIDILANFKNEYDFKISLDSYHPATIEYFLNRVDIINDVSNSLPNSTLKKIHKTGKVYLFMHSITVPANPLIHIALGTNPCDEIFNWAKNKLEQLYSIGFTKDQLIFDVGIGFNKTESQSWFLLKNISKFHELGIEILVGHSRKRFMNKITMAEYSKRDYESAIIGNFLLSERVDYVRVHDYNQLIIASNIYNQLR